MSYTNIFGGFNINTSFPSYQSFIFDNNLQLTWASSFVDNSNVTAQTNDLNATNISLTVTLADATLISVGQTIQFNNVGLNSVQINDFLGGFIVNIPPTNGNQIILYLRDNTTQAGIWGITNLGSGTSSADASLLAGLGTIALNSRINTNFPGKSINTNYQVLLSDRASILIWKGGSGTITLPPQIDGFPIAVNNEGSGAISITTPDAKTIDGQNSFSLNPSESSYFIGVESNWNTLGFGVESFFQVNVLSPLDLSAVGSSLTLTNQQASRLVQQYTGLLTENVTVYYPAAAGQWYIWNNTTGAFTVTAQLSGPTGSPIVIPQGEKVILYSDGTSIYNTPTIATSAVFNDGTEGIPGISFISDSSTGFYKIPPLPDGVVGYSSSGTLSLTLGGQNSGIGFGINGGLPGVYWNTANANYVGFKAPLGLTGNIIFSLPGHLPSVNGQILTGTTTGLTGFSGYTIDFPFNPNGLFFAAPGDVIQSLVTANNGILVTNNVGIPSISSTLPSQVQNNITGLGIVTSGTVTVAAGGTGINTTTPYGVICGGTTPTGNFQNVSPGSAGQIFTSNGAGALPSWQSISSSLTAATKDQQISGVSTSTYVCPARQQFHNSAVKAWVSFNATNGNIFAQYNVSSVVRNSTGRYTINFLTPFASNNYAIEANAELAVGDIRVICVNLSPVPTTTQVQLLSYSLAGILNDPVNISCSFQGVQ